MRLGQETRSSGAPGHVTRNQFVFSTQRRSTRTNPAFASRFSQPGGAGESVMFQARIRTGLSSAVSVRELAWQPDPRCFAGILLHIFSEEGGGKERARFARRGGEGRARLRV